MIRPATADEALDLTISRVIRAPRSAVWRAWTDARSFEQWWVPKPARAKVVEMDVRPGGALVTQISEDGGPFVPHVSFCYLAVEPEERLVFTNSLLGGWRPAPQSFITAVITLGDHPEGTAYRALVMHKSTADREMHEQLGFHDGWGTVAAQLAELVERQAGGGTR